jgi:5-methylcytosine-specific restriction endonuclease McrA
VAPVTGSVPEPARPRFSTRWPVRLGSGVAISLAMLGRLACDAGLRRVADLPDGTQLNLGRHRRTPDAALRRALLARDVHCRFPGCDSRQRLHAHHIIWWILGGRTDLDNLILLCPKHHSAIHDRHWTLSGTADAPRFARPDGGTVDHRPAELSGTLVELAAAHRAHGLDIAVDHVGGRWSGDQIDWDCFFAAVANPLLPPTAAAA